MNEINNARSEEPSWLSPHAARLGGPCRITVLEARAEFRKGGVPDLRDTAFVDTELACNVAVLPVEIEQQRNDSVLSRRKALPGAVQSRTKTSAGRGQAVRPSSAAVPDRNGGKENHVVPQWPSGSCG
jgi:hypothetical protein